MTTKEMIEVMQAFARGEQIEYREKKDSEWLPLFHDPYWDWAQFEYRIKSKPTCRPYKNASEFLQAQKEHGMNIRLKWCNCYMLPLYITNILIGVQYPQGDGSIVDIDVSYEELLRDYTWQDGTPCGVKEE